MPVAESNPTAKTCKADNTGEAWRSVDVKKLDAIEPEITMILGLRIKQSKRAVRRSGRSNHICAWTRSFYGHAKVMKDAGIPPTPLHLLFHYFQCCCS